MADNQLLNLNKRQIDTFFLDFKKNIFRQKEDGIIRFFEELQFRKRIYDQYKAQNDRFLSSDFNLFDYLNTDENDLSNYIGMILDITGAHGQGNIFLNLFIDYLHEIGLNDIEKQDYSIAREYWADGRIDIFLYGDNTAIIIENKPWAKDQDKQLERYYRSIHSTKRSDIFIVYLSSGSDPDQRSIDPEMLNELKRQKRFAAISLVHFASKYLVKAYQHCESLKFRFFLADFIKFLEYHFSNAEEH